MFAKINKTKNNDAIEEDCFQPSGKEELEMKNKENCNIISETSDSPTEEEPLQQNGQVETDEHQTKKTFCQMCRYVLKNVTVEPSMSLFVLTGILGMLTTQNLSLEKACRVNLQFPAEICQSLKMQQIGSMNVYEKETQKLLTKYLAARTYITATVPCILALFAGSWSDKTGYRKVFIIIPIFGQFLCCINNIINTYFFYELSLEVLIFSDAVLEGFSGGWCLCFVIIFSYISAVTTVETRTFRMGLISFSMTVGFPIGMGISGVMLKNYGYYVCYGFAASLHAINLLYNTFIFKDAERTVEQKKHDNQGIRHFFRTFFDLTNIRDAIRVVFKKGPNKRRRRMCIMMLVVSILFGPMYGEISILYLSTRYRFNWDEVMFSIFQSYNFVSHTVGTIFSISVFSKYLQWHDSILGIISTSSKIAASFVYCFAPNGRVFFIAPLVDILNGTSLLAIRSLVSKLVAPDELGKVNSIFGIAENLMPLVYVPLYTNVYKSTMEVLPGAVFLMGAAMTLPAVIVFIWLLYEHRKEVRRIKHDSEPELPMKESLLISKPKLV